MPYQASYPIDRISFTDNLCLIDHNAGTARTFIRPEDVARGHVTFVTYDNSTFIERRLGEAAITLSVPSKVEQRISNMAINH